MWMKRTYFRPCHILFPPLKTMCHSVMAPERNWSVPSEVPVSSDNCSSVTFNGLHCQICLVARCKRRYTYLIKDTGPTQSCHNVFRGVLVFEEVPCSEIRYKDVGQTRFMWHCTGGNYKWCKSTDFTAVVMIWCQIQIQTKKGNYIF